LLDAIDAFKRESFDAEVWRISRDRRDPTQGARSSKSRWTNGTFDVLYTSFERDGALAEVYALLSSQPVFPSASSWFVHRLKGSASNVLNLADLTTLERLGVEIGRYGERDYKRTQEIADCAYFLGFDALIVPSARWTCRNLILFTDRIPPGKIEVIESTSEPIAWEDWRNRTRR
jgi:hypothetical protein